MTAVAALQDWIVELFNLNTDYVGCRLPPLQSSVEEQRAMIQVSDLCQVLGSGTVFFADSVSMKLTVFSASSKRCGQAINQHSRSVFPEKALLS